MSSWQLRGQPYRWWVWAGPAASALGLLTTVAVDIPLNNDLANMKDPTAAREHFEQAWVTWNVVRAVAVDGGAGMSGAGTGPVRPGHERHFSAPVGIFQPVRHVRTRPSRPIRGVWARSPQH